MTNDESSAAPAERDVWFSIPGHLVESVEIDPKAWFFPPLKIADDGTVTMDLPISNEEFSMPTHVERRDGKFRVVDPNGAVTTNKAGTSVDGGGHATRQEAEAQSRAINSNDGKKVSR